MVRENQRDNDTDRYELTLAQSRQVAGAAERKARARSPSIKTAYPTAFSQAKPLSRIGRSYDRDRDGPQTSSFMPRTATLTLSAAFWNSEAKLAMGERLSSRTTLTAATGQNQQPEDRDETFLLDQSDKDASRSSGTLITAAPVIERVEHWLTNAVASRGETGSNRSALAQRELSISSRLIGNLSRRAGRWLWRRYVGDATMRDAATQSAATLGTH